MNKNFLILAISLALLPIIVPAQADEPCCKYLFSFRHDDIITCAAFSKNGRWLATGSELGTVIVTDLESRKEFEIKNPDSLDNGVVTLRFSQDGQLLLIGGYGNRGGGGEIKILRTSDYTVAMALDAPGSEPVDYLDVSPDNKWLIAVDHKSARIWNLPDKRVSSHLILTDSAMLFDGDRTLLLAAHSASLDVNHGESDNPITTIVGAGQIVLFDVIDGRVTRVLRTAIEEPVMRLFLAKAKKELFVLTAGGTVYRLDSKTGEVKQHVSLSDLYRRVSPKSLNVWFKTDFEALEDYPILVFSDRVNTFFVNYDSGKVIALDHRSQVGLQFSPSGKEFALLGGVKQPSLTGVTDQHYWTVNLFSFKPF